MQSTTRAISPSTLQPWPSLQAHQQGANTPDPHDASFDAAIAIERISADEHPVASIAYEVPDSFESKHVAPEQFPSRPVPAPHPTISRAQSARQALVRALAGEDTHEAARAAHEAISQLAGLAVELPEGEVDRVLSGFLRDAVAAGHEKQAAAWVDAVAGIPGFGPRKLALLQGAVAPISATAWTPQLAANPVGAIDLAASSSPGRPLRFGVPLLIRTFMKQRGRGDADPRWMNPITEAESKSVRGSFSYVAAVLDSPLLSDSQASDVIAVSTMSHQGVANAGGSNKTTLTALQFAMRQSHVCGYGSLVLAILSSSRSPEMKSALLQRLDTDWVWLARKLAALGAQPVPENPDEDQFGWARAMAGEMRELFGQAPAKETDQIESAGELTLPRPRSRRD